MQWFQESYTYEVVGQHVGEAVVLVVAREVGGRALAHVAQRHGRAAAGTLQQLPAHALQPEARRPVQQRGVFLAAWQCNIQNFCESFLSLHITVRSTFADKFPVPHYSTASRTCLVSMMSQTSAERGRLKWKGTHRQSYS